MPIIKFKPTTPGRRFSTKLDNSDLTVGKPHKKLTKLLKKNSGRNNKGRVTCRHKGGGNRRKYRMIDFRRNKDNVPAKVKTIEYDPNRNVRIALVLYNDGEYRYILAPKNINVGDEILSGEKIAPKVGYCMPMKNIPTSMAIHNIETQVGKGAQLVRSAGGSAQVMGKEKNYVIVLLPSGEMRKINHNCRATIGQLGNVEYNKINWGKAGRKRWMGIRPTVRGTAQNPVSHPMGGGEGRSGGGRHPCSPTGKLAKGGKTRKKNKPSSKFIMRGRKKGKFQK